MRMTRWLGFLGVFLLVAWPGLGWAQEDATTPPDEDTTAEEEAMDEEASTPAGVQRVSDRLATQFNVTTEQIGDLREQNMGFGEIHHALTLAQQLPGGLTQENIDQVMTLRNEQKMGWGQIAHEFDTTLGKAIHTPAPAPTEPSAEGGTAEGGTTETGMTTGTAGQAESLIRPGSTRGGPGKAKATGRSSFGTDTGMTRSGGGKGSGYGGARSGGSRGFGGGTGRGGGGLGGGKSSSAPGHNR